MVTTRDVANKAKVSLSTVSRVINDFPNVNEQTRQAVLNAVKELGYVISTGQNKTHDMTVGIMVPRDTGINIMAHPTLYTVISGISQKLGEASIRNTLLMIDDSSDMPLKNAISKDIDAYILIGTSQKEEDDLIPQLISNNTPVILVNRWIEYSRVNFVNIDDEGASFEAVEHLISLGHKVIGFVNGNPNFRNSKLRFQGYKRAIEKNNIQFEEQYVISGKYDEETGYKAAKALSRLNPVPTAVFTSSDIIAIGLQKGFKEIGFKLPQDISIIGFGDIELASYVQPSLTTIRMPAFDMGMEAAESAIKILEKKSVKYIRIVMESELVIRESTIPFKK